VVDAGNHAVVVDVKAAGLGRGGHFGFSLSGAFPLMCIAYSTPHSYASPNTPQYVPISAE